MQQLDVSFAPCGISNNPCAVLEATAVCPRTVCRLKNKSVYHPGEYLHAFGGVEFLRLALAPLYVYIYPKCSLHGIFDDNKWSLSWYRWELNKGTLPNNKDIWFGSGTREKLELALFLLSPSLALCLVFSGSRGIRDIWGGTRTRRNVAKERQDGCVCFGFAGSSMSFMTAALPGTATRWDVAWVSGHANGRWSQEEEAVIGLGCVGEFEAGSQLAFASRGLSFFRCDFLFFGQLRARFQTSHTVITVLV